MFRIGSHITSSKGYLAMGKLAHGIGATTLQFFVRNPRGGRARPLDPNDIAAFNRFAGENDISDILAHASYVLNLATPEPDKQKFVRETVRDDLLRLAHFPGAMYNIHPGARKDSSPEEAVRLVAESIDAAYPEESGTTFLLETMSGHGGEVGGTFEDLAAVIRASRNGKRLGVCLDTCHVFTAGYDIVNDLDAVLKHFDKVLGLRRLRAVHLNDSLMELGSHRDRHAKIGEGHIGLDAFARIINHPLLRDLPFYLETPNELKGYGEEIALLKSLRSDGASKKKTAKAAKPTQAAKSAKPSKTAKPVKSAKPVKTPEAVKTGKAVKTAAAPKTRKTVKTEKPARTAHSDKTAKADKTAAAKTSPRTKKVPARTPGPSAGKSTGKPKTAAR
ncbi:MAG: deoxyribonuclease IV [Planctomycetaceae bacterium]|nr:deoxyribonuclease IV [Planctomycetaceae bacterium]